MSIEAIRGAAPGVDVANAKPARSESDFSRRRALPGYGVLCVTAAVPVALAVAVALVTEHARIAAGLTSGLVTALVMYAGIYSFVSGASELAVRSVGGKANARSAPFLPVFALVAVAKFVALGALLYLFFRVLHIGSAAFAAGFLIAQVAVTFACVRSLVEIPLIERSGRARN